jgi:hypothetical protein
MSKDAGHARMTNSAADAAGRLVLGARASIGAPYTTNTPPRTDRPFLGNNPPLGLAVQRHGDELRLVTAAEVTRSVERHLNMERPVALSRAALEREVRHWATTEKGWSDPATVHHVLARTREQFHFRRRSAGAAVRFDERDIGIAGGPPAANKAGSETGR